MNNWISVTERLPEYNQWVLFLKHISIPQHNTESNLLDVAFASGDKCIINSYSDLINALEEMVSDTEI